MMERHSQTRSGTDFAAGELIWMIGVAAIPILYAVFTWDHSSAASLTAMRQFGFPALLIAIAIIALAIVRLHGVSPLFAPLPAISRVALAIVVGIALASAFMAEANPGYAALKTWTNLIILLFGLALFALITKQTAMARQQLPRLILFGFAIYLLIVVAYIATAPDDFNWPFFGMTAQNIRNLGSHAMVIAAFSSGAAVTWHGRWRLPAIFVAIVAVGILCWSGSRGSALIYVTSTLIALPWLGARTLGRNLALLLMICIAGAALSLLHHVEHTAFGLWRVLGIAQQFAQPENISSGRITVWLMTIDLLKTMPLAGYGDGQFFYHFDGPKRLAFPHNVVLQLWFQWGWIGGTLAIALLGWLGLASVKHWLSARKAALPSFLMLTTIGAYGMIDGPFYDTLPMLFFAIATALCLTCERNEQQPQKV